MKSEDQKAALSSGFAPRVGIPFRTCEEETSGRHDRLANYREAIRQAGGLPAEISLMHDERELEELAAGFDAFVLPGSPADVNPAHYGEERHVKTATADARREATDSGLVRHAFDHGKPLLGICYGMQLLNTFLGGSLVQDIVSEIPGALDHVWHRAEGRPEPFHSIRLEASSRLAQFAGKSETNVNTSHHQAVRDPGRGLWVSARASDGVIEAVEWRGGPQFVVGVEWHPERMAEDRLSEALFRELVQAAARGAKAAGHAV